MDKGKSLRSGMILLLLSAICLALAFIYITLGSTKISLAELVNILRGQAEQSTAYGVVWKLRLPRMLSCVLLGGALALSGFLLQTFFANPIAGPYVLGISSGAKLSVAIVMVGLLGSFSSLPPAVLVAAAFVGSLGSMSFVLMLSQRVKSASMLIVGGVMIGYICSAATDFLVSFADDASIVNLHNWSRGSFSGISWEDVGVMAAVVGICAIFTFLLSKPIGAYSLGEAYAQNLGVPIKAFRAALVVCSSIFSACVTAFAGPVSFVGIAVPHLVKALLRTSKPIIVIPACFLGGSIFCLLCDLIARTLFSPTELSISSVTAIFGAPIVIGIMLNRRKGKEI